MDEKKDMKEYVENKILKITLRAKNFSKDEIDYVDDYCKERYDNNRKLMILDLIRYKDENVALNLMDEKINFLFQEIQKQQGDPVKKNTNWKGFSK